jgi:hypothetical protein
MTITHERIREVLHYEPETGVFTWLVRTSSRMHVGDLAGSRTKKGYWAIRLDHGNHRAHLLAWLYMTGAWPTHQIDHIDGDGLNNRWTNLRDGSDGVNYHNIVAPQSNNTSGYRGVSWERSRGRWQAQIQANRKKRHLGYFDTPEEASAAYWAAKAELHGAATYQVRLGCT